MTPILFAQLKYFQQMSPAEKTGFIIGGMIGTTIAVVVCGAIVIMVGASKGHVTLGIIGALLTVPAAAFLGCLGGLPVAAVMCFIIKILPTPKNQPLLSRAEIEAETRRARGF
jgi:hypothetical protein